MKILVPVDFSSSSNNAALYGAEFAKKSSAELFLLHVVHIEHPPMVQVTETVDHKIEGMRISDATKECALLVDELKSKIKGVEIFFKVIAGFPLESLVENFVKSNQVDLVIMGAKNSSGFSKLVFGNSSTAVINKSSVPVITVPESSAFNDVRVIVYASDMHTNQSEIVEIIPIAKLFHASINILHVLPVGSEKKFDKATLEKDLIEKYEYSKISLHLAYSSNVLGGINEFIAQVNADLLVMYTHEIGFFESLFRTSLTREEALNCSVPILTFKNKA